jgi:dedicator of cytokinesis protein 3
MILYQKRRAVWRLAGDIRGEGAAILLRLWLALGWPDHASANTGGGLPYGVSQFCSFPMGSYCHI